MNPSQAFSRLSIPLLSSMLALTVSFSLVACGGGGGTSLMNQETAIPTINQQAAIPSTPDLDGPVSNAGVGTASDQRPDVGQVGNDPVQGLFSFDLQQVPTGAAIVSATLQLTSIGITGEPVQRLGGKLVIDQLNFGATFPSELDNITDIVQSGVARWDNLTVLGPRTFDVTEQVRADRIAGRSRSQYQVRGLIRTEGDTIDLVTLAGAENQNGDAPILRVVWEFKATSER